MKINTKLVISNIVITITSMIILSLVITHVIKNHIQTGIEKDLIISNNAISEKLYYSSGLKQSHFMGKKNQDAIMVFIIDKNNSILINADKNLLTQQDEINLVNTLSKLNLNEIQDIKFSKKDALAYAQSTEVYGKEYIVCTAIFNTDVSQIISKITNVVILLIFVISIITILVTTLISNKITSPFNVILNGTKSFANKNFDKKIVVESNDEFGDLAKAMNDMAYKLKIQDIEQKKFYEDYSHDLKTPLTVISGYAQGVRSGVIEDSDKSLELIEDECGKLKKQIENMIYLSKLDTVNDIFNFEKLELNKLVSESLTNLDSLIIIKDINIDFEVENKIYIDGDREKLIRAFTNLFSNCVKYTKDTIKIICLEQNLNAVVIICDNGKGFSEEVLENPFKRNNNGSQNGSGIGLSIVKKIINKHNGKIELQNSIDGGACYKITLPKLCHK